MKTRKPIRPVSKALAKRKRQYSPIRAKWLAINSRCAVFPNRRATEIHHTRGRIGRLLNMTEFWVPVSREGYRWINDNPAEARNRTWYGIPLLCAVRQWNTAPR